MNKLLVDHSHNSSNTLYSLDLSRSSSSYLNYSGDDSSAVSSEDISQMSIPSNHSLFTIEEKRNQKHRQRLYLDKIEREKREEAESEKTSQVIRENAIKRRQEKAAKVENHNVYPHSQTDCQSSSHRESPGTFSSSYTSGVTEKNYPRYANGNESGEIANESIQVVDKHEERKKKRKATISTVS